MDLSTPNYYQPPSFYASSQMESQERKTKGIPFAEALNNSNEDPICKLNLKETSDFVKSLPMSFNNGTQRRREHFGNRKLEAPLTPGRPIFSFSVSRKSVPSKWDDAEKWVFNGGGSCHESPAHHDFNSSNYYNHVIKQNEIIKSSNSKAIINEVIAEKFRVFEEGKISNGVTIPADLPLKDKFTDEIGPYVSNIRYSKPTKEAFLFKTQKHGNNDSMTDACTEIIPIHDTKHRDIGTEMTPLGSNTTSRCHTPFKSSSPARHNTPTSRSGPLALTDQSTSSIDMAQLQECNFSKLQIGSTQFDSVTTNWSSREEEEEEISKSLRHFEFGRRSSVSINETRACANWEDEENAKFCLRYQREEAKIHAWVNLQTAKAEAQSRKLEVKIQKMRSNLEEKLMKKMAIVHRKAEEWRVAAQVEHCEQIKRASERTHNLIFNHQNTNLSSHIISCGCFPCSSK